jgi:hypothetical protein
MGLEVMEGATPILPPPETAEVERKGEEEEEEEEGGGAKVTLVPPSVMRRLPCALSLSSVKIGTE